MFSWELSRQRSQCDHLLQALVPFGSGTSHVEDAPAAVAIAEALHERTGVLLLELQAQVATERRLRERE